MADSAPDVMLFQDEPIDRFVQSGVFLDLAPFAERDGMQLKDGSFWPVAIESFSRPNDQGGTAVYGLPVFGGTNLLFYNRDAFHNAGIVVNQHNHPDALHRASDQRWLLDDDRWTIDDFRAVAQRLTADDDGDGRIDRFGYSMPNAMYWLPWHWAMGASMLNDHRDALTHFGPAAEASLQLYQDLRYADRVAPTPAELGTMGSSIGFMTGSVAMIDNGPWFLPFINATGTPFGLLHMPAGPAGRATRVTWDMVGVYAQTRRPDDAWRFVAFCADADGGQRIIAKYQRSYPARRAAAETFLNPPHQDGPTHPDLHKFFDAAGSYARVQPVSPHWTIMIRTWNRSLEGLMHPTASQRISPRESIAVLLNDQPLVERLPIADPDAATPYLNPRDQP